MTMPRGTVRILAIDDAGEGAGLRDAIEVYDHAVELFWIGTPTDLVQTLRLDAPRSLVIITGHGDRGGLLLPEYAAEVAAQQPFLGHLGPRQIAEHADFAGSPVFCTACDGGVLAEAVLGAGAPWYVAAADAPNGDATYAFCVAFLYQLLARGRNPDEALPRARQEDDDSIMFRCWHAGSDAGTARIARPAP